jgi:hypothetical protein
MMDLLPPGHVRWIDIVVMQTRSPFIVSGALHDSDGEKVELHHCLVVGSEMPLRFSSSVQLSIW